MTQPSKKDILDSRTEQKLSNQLFRAINSSTQDDVLVASLTLLAKVKRQHWRGKLHLKIKAAVDRALELVKEDYIKDAAVHHFHDHRDIRHSRAAMEHLSGVLGVSQVELEDHFAAFEREHFSSTGPDYSDHPYAIHDLDRGPQTPGPHKDEA